ncbi:MAG: hypothetical protein OXH76_21430 [Boseongicola sp.]|nr:hypothetical protein [Boseongicola sp.]
MAVKAIFAEIDRHLDPAVPEPSGARRDAMALWALFTDAVREVFLSAWKPGPRSHGRVPSGTGGRKRVRMRPWEA